MLGASLAKLAEGAPGGVTGREFREGSPRVAQFLRQQGSARDRWRPPAADGTSPEAEWGFAEPLAEDVAALAADRAARLERLQFEEPEDLSPLIAELFRDRYAEAGLPDGRLLVSSFLLMDPMLAMRTGSVPYWALFGAQPSLERLAGYLSRAARYDDIRLTIFPHGVESIGLPGIGEWQAMLGYARQGGQLLAIEPGRYPRHFRALTGFHRELDHGPATSPTGDGDTAVRVGRSPAVPGPFRDHLPSGIETYLTWVEDVFTRCCRWPTPWQVLDLLDLRHLRRAGDHLRLALRARDQGPPGPHRCRPPPAAAPRNR
jgi:hypothetical protein